MTLGQKEGELLLWRINHVIGGWELSVQTPNLWWRAEGLKAQMPGWDAIRKQYAKGSMN